MNEFNKLGRKNFIDQNYIEVKGDTKLEVSPNMIFLKIILSDKNSKDKQTLPEIEKRVIDKLSEVGVDVAKDLSLIDFGSDLKDYLFKKDVILTKQYQLLVHDSKILQKVFLEFQKIGISDVSIEKLEHSNIEQYKRENMVSAVKAAKEKAEMLAIALNQKIGKALYVVETTYLDFAPNIRARRRVSYEREYSEKKLFSSKHNDLLYSPMETDTATEIEFSQINISCTCLVRFALE